MTIDGASDKLKATQVVATLESPIPAGKNAIWCASFLCAWKAMERELAGEAIALEGSPPLAAVLNEAPDPTAQVPPEALYVATGWVPKGILDKIVADVPKRFPGTQPPSFPGITNDSFVAYSCLQANVRFALPYSQSRKPLSFTDGGGRKTPVRSFGIRDEDADAYEMLRTQAALLFQKDHEGRDYDPNFEFAVDLCVASQPTQIVVARIDRPASLAEALGRVGKEIAGTASQGGNSGDLGHNYVLLVPDLFWRLSHTFMEIEGKEFTNAKMKGQRLDVVRQDILFRLDRSGAELKSQAVMHTLGHGFGFVLDRPFLIYMKKRGAEAPYFAMWVDNAELLQQW